MKDLFDLYKLEKERNGLYKENGSNVKLELYIKQNYISKDKIREKITECEEAMNKVKQFNPSTYAGIDTFIYAMAQKNILKSLLEEE